MKYLTSFVLFLGLTLSAEKADRPNVIVILTDDMGFSDLGCFGGEIDTPNLDKLAKNGLRFTEFYNTARCWPTRATLMSGIYSNGLGTGQVTIPCWGAPPGGHAHDPRPLSSQVPPAPTRRNPTKVRTGDSRAAAAPIAARSPSPRQANRARSPTPGC